MFITSGIVVDEEAQSLISSGGEIRKDKPRKEDILQES
jgi:hypothetical protein